MQVTATMGPAWETMKRVLFRPFNLGTWFSFGFVFFLQSCIDGSGSFNMPGSDTFTGGKSHGSGGGGGLGTHPGTDDSLFGLLHSHSANAASPLSDLLGNADSGILVTIAVVAVIAMIPVMALVYWLGTRGQMMSIRAVAVERAEIGRLWNETKPSGTSLFKFHLVVGALSLVAFLPLVAGGLVTALPVLRDGAPIESVLPVLLGLGAVFLVVLVPFAILNFMTRNFVAPIMLKHGLGARDAWRRFWPVGRQHVAPIFGYALLRGVVYTGATLAGTLASVFTCCLGFLPVLHQTLMAPYAVFERAWSLEVLASMSPDFDLRQGPGPMAPPPAPWQAAGPAPYNPYAGAPQDNPYAPPGWGGPGGGHGPGGQGGPPPGGFGSPT